MRNGAIKRSLAAITMISAMPAFVAAQSASGTKSVPNAQKGTDRSAAVTTPASATGKKPWKLSYTPDGQPDMQGIWTNLSFTPMVRPAEFGNREFLTKEELDKAFKEGIQRSY